jgi:hypothetical protein
MEEHREDRSRHAVPISSLDTLVATPPVAATAEMPADIKAMIAAGAAIYVKADRKPTLDLVVEPAPGAAGYWRVTAKGLDLLTEVPGHKAEQLEPAVAAPAVKQGKEPAMLVTEGHRPPWIAEELMPRLVPFRTESGIAMEPLAIEEGRRLQYPWCTVGRVRNSLGRQGTGVMVGPNLMMTAGHVAPWGQSPWWMEFTPAFRAGDANPPFGVSFVSQYRGFNPNGSVTGTDYVVCRLMQPLGRAVGWMGSRWWSNDDEYERRTYVSHGYPGTFAGRMAAEFDIRLADIDNDSPGLELEIPLRPDIGPGWSGGPLWLPGEGNTVVGIRSGREKDFLDPTRGVYAGGRALVDLVKFGLANWPV